MAYIRQIIGADEKLVGIARLHWIYVLRGVLWLAGYAAFGIFLHAVIDRGVVAAEAMARSPALLTPVVILDEYSEGATFFLGAVICACFLVKYLSTEIGLTNRRVIRKEGLAFVHVHEVDIEEIHGEKMDLGYFGKILGYGYIKLDCRFVGDFSTPAIRKPEQFMRALHRMRSQVTDSASMIATKPAGAPVQPAAPTPPPVATAPAPAAPQAPAAATIDPAMLSQIVAEIVPQVVEQVSEKMAAPDTPDHRPSASEAQLLADFSRASAQQSRALH